MLTTVQCFRITTDKLTTVQCLRIAAEILDCEKWNTR